MLLSARVPQAVTAVEREIRLLADRGMEVVAVVDSHRHLVVVALDHLEMPGIVPGQDIDLQDVAAAREAEHLGEDNLLLVELQLISKQARISQQIQSFEVGGGV